MRFHLQSQLLFSNTQGGHVGGLRLYYRRSALVRSPKVHDSLLKKRDEIGVSYRSRLWDRYWGQYSFSSFDLSPVTVPQAPAGCHLLQCSSHLLSGQLFVFNSLSDCINRSRSCVLVMTTMARLQVGSWRKLL